MGMSYQQLATQKVLNIQKALTYTQGTSTIIPEFIPPNIEFLAEYQNPLVQNLARINQDGSDHYLVTRDVADTADMLAPEGEPVDRTGSDPTEHKFYFKICGALIKVGKFRRAASGGSRGVDLYLQKLTNAIFNMKNKLDNQYTVGDGSGYDMYGLKYLITQSILAGSCDDGNALTTELVDEAMDECVQVYPTMILSHPVIRRKFQALLQDQQRFVNVVKVQGGFMLMEYNGAAYYVSSNMSKLQNYTYSGGCEGAETGGTTGSMYFLNGVDVGICTLDNCYFRASKSDDAATIWDGTDFLSWLTLFVRNPNNTSKLLGIKAN